jgi:membrane-associated phospholipid phosphatase
VNIVLPAAAVVFDDHQYGFRAVNDFARATPWLHGFMRDYAQFGVVLFAALMLWAWWTARGHTTSEIAASLWAPAGMLLALGLNQPVVNWNHEARPYTELPHVLLLVGRSSDYSYPSDHAVMAGAVAAGIFLADRRLGIVAGLAALLMAFARVYVGAHYPADVVAGLLFGSVVTFFVYLVVRPVLVRAVTAVGRTPAWPLVSTVRGRNTNDD